jgi:crossover junction endodeoxyribonuclease RuvC
LTLTTDRIILGIDPGTTIMGYGIIQIKGNKPELISMGVLKLGTKFDHATKLKKIFEHTQEVIDTYHPDEVAIEAPFFGKDVQAMLKLGRAQGVAMAAALSRSVPIFEYSPRKIKKSITGNGNSSKEQVAIMLKTTLSLESVPEQLDASDGIAAAVCHFYQRFQGSGGKSYSSWGGFVNKNKDRII